MSFKFTSNDVFVLVRRGIVFRGKVLNGELSINQRVTFNTTEGELSADVTLIECDRKNFNSTIEDKEIGLLLNNFDKKFASDMIQMNPTDEEMDLLPAPIDMLKAKYPLIISKCTKVTSESDVVLSKKIISKNNRWWNFFHSKNT